MRVGGRGTNVREVVYEEAHEMAAPSRKRHLGGEARRALELFIDPNRKTQAVLLELIPHANPSAAFHLPTHTAPLSFTKWRHYAHAYTPTSHTTHTPQK